MKNFDYRILWGLLLVLAGGLFLLENLGIITFGSLIFAALLGVIGLTFLFFLFTDRSRWWAAIPGFILTYLSGLIFFQYFLPRYADQIGGPLFLLVIALSFWTVYFLNTSFWWAIIPAGVLSTLAVVSALDTIFENGDFGGVFFLGLGLTFGILALLPTPAGRMRWPLIPAGILLLLGIVLLTISGSMFNYLWPVALILGGLYLLFFRNRVRI